MHVCIVDLIDHRRLGAPVQAFASPAELRAHLADEKHYFPMDAAKQKGQGLLKVLLRTITE